MSASSINLSRFSGPVLAQQPYNSCAAHALYSVVHSMTQQAGALRKISIYQIYADARLMVGVLDSDPGVGALSDLLILKAGQQKGLAEASIWPNDKSLMYVRPTAEVYENAAQFKIDAYRQLPAWVSSATWTENIKRELSNGKPLVCVIKNFEGLGPHVVAIEGVDDSKQSYIYKNSFGADWGEAGYGYLHYSQNTNFFGVYTIDHLGPFDFTYSPERIKIAQLYACILGRCPELAGLNFWANLLKSGWNAAQIAQCLIDSPEGREKYASTTDVQFVEAMYQNVLGRTSDEPGLRYFVGLLESGARRGDIYASTIEHIDIYKGSDAGTRASADCLDNKANVAMYYAVALQMDGSRIDLARAALVGVTADPAMAEAAKESLATALNR